jgi:flagellar FliL protein
LLLGRCPALVFTNNPLTNPIRKSVKAMATITLPAKTPTTSRKPTLKFILLLAGLTALAAAAAAGATWYLSSQRHADAGPVAVLPAAPIFVAVEPVTVNLQPNGRARFLHAGVTLKLPDAKAQALVTEYLPEVRSRVLTVMSNRSSDALITPEDKAKLAAEIMESLNQPLVANLPSLKISSVMFTTFMLQ